MSKREVAWLIVRVIGVCLVLNACRYLFIVLENVMLASQAKNAETILSEASGLISGWLIEGIVSFIAGLYFLKNGCLLFQLLNYEPNRGSLGEYKYKSDISI
ncbi:MAG: hypothetical protein M3261_00060 [Thermoproteota archaeon]|nr:hypothetical protein [Thermoproteota archaeon]